MEATAKGEGPVAGGMGLSVSHVPVDPDADPGDQPLGPQRPL